MLNRDHFAHRPVYGMVHLLPLPGAPLFGGSIDAVTDAALRDARAISDGGCDGILFENFGDKPFHATRVEAITIAAMTRVISDVVRAVRLPFGVNVLRNDAPSALAIAAATGAKFIRVNVHTGAMFTDQGMIEGDAAETMRMRARLAPNVSIFADHFVKHAVPPAGIDAAQAAKDLRQRGLADVIIISGAETGSAPDADRLRIVREALGDSPLFIGSGLTDANASAFADADGAIVGTAIKRGGRVDEPVERQRVERVVAAFKARGGR